MQGQGKNSKLIEYLSESVELTKDLSQISQIQDQNDQLRFMPVHM